jgi:hypothetical protein
MAESEGYKWSRSMMPESKQGNDAIRILAGECTITRITNGNERERISTFRIVGEYST